MSFVRSSASDLTELLQTFSTRQMRLAWRKMMMAGTGLFLCLFLVVHLGANLLLLLPEDLARAAYNSYSTTLRESPLVQIVAVFLYLSIVLHTVYAAMITRHNRRAKPDRYAANEAAANSTWASRNMGLLGFMLLVFLIVHLANFWARIKLGIGDELRVDADGHLDVYEVTTTLFRNIYYVAFYSLLMIPLGLHLYHGVKSAFQTLGLYHRRWLSRLAKLGLAYTLLVSIGFAVIPVFIYLRHLIS